MSRHVLLALAWVGACSGFLPERAGAESASELYAVAQRAFEQGLYAPAAASLKTLLRDYPDDTLSDDAEYLLALSLIYTGSYEQAARSLEQFARRYPGSPFLSSVSYWLGFARYSLGQAASAIGAFRSQVDSYPAEGRYRQYSLSYLAELYERSGDLGRALDACRELLASGAGGEIAATALYRVGSISLGRREWSDAAAAFARVRLEHPGSSLAAAAECHEAEALFQRGEKIEATRRYRSFLEAASGRKAELASLVELACYRLAGCAAERQDAVELFSRVDEMLAAFPSSEHLPELLTLRGEAEVGAGRLREARASYAAALERTRDPAGRQRISFNLAVCAAGLGDSGAALAYLESAVSGPDAALAARSSYRKAVILAGKGEGEGAIPILLALGARGGAEEEVLRFTGELLDEADRAAEARGVWSELLARFGTSEYAPRYLYRRGAAALALGDNAAALEDFVSFIRLYATRPGTSLPGSAAGDAGRDHVAELAAEARYNIGFVYAARGEYVRALPYFAAAAEGTANAELAGRARFAEGVAAYNIEDYVAALDAFRRYVAGAGEAAGKGRGYLSLGKAELRSGDADASVASLRKAADMLEGTEEGAESLSWLGIALSRLGRGDASRDAYLELLRRYPGSPRAQGAELRVGVAARLAGELDESIEHLRKAVDSCPSGDRSGPREEALYELGLAFISLGREGDARRAFSQISREYPGSTFAPEGYLKIAQASFESGEYRDAALEFQEVSRGFAKADAAGPAVFWAAESWLRAGDRERAASGYWDYLKRYPGGSYAQSAESGIAGIAGEVEDTGSLRRLYEAAEGDSGAPAALRSCVRLEYAAALLGRGAWKEASGVAEGIDPELLDEPFRGEAHLLAARLLRKGGSLDAALGVFGALSSSRADRVGAESLFDLGQTLAEAGRKQDALNELLRFSVLYAQHKDLVPRALHAAMLLLKETGDTDGAARLAARITEEFPGFKPPR